MKALSGFGATLWMRLFIVLRAAAIRWRRRVRIGIRAKYATSATTPPVIPGRSSALPIVTHAAALSNSLPLAAPWVSQTIKEAF